jgi:membrane protein YqaA with SNARE-associated domain
VTLLTPTLTSAAIVLLKLHPLVWLHKFTVLLTTMLKPLGIWGLGALSLLDSAMIPIPGSMDWVVVSYVRTAPHRVLLYCLMAAGASALGSMVPYYIGRAGGELVLLKRINRERYERMRDRFERQEFIAVMIPSMGPPPTPLKLFQFAAGVFEMRPLPFALATFLGKLTQFLVWSLLYLWFGEAIFHRMAAEFHRHAAVGFTLGGLIVLAAVLYVVRKLFDRRRGELLPVEEIAVVSEEDAL